MLRGYGATRVAECFFEIWRFDVAGERHSGRLSGGDSRRGARLRRILGDGTHDADAR